MSTEAVLLVESANNYGALLAATLTYVRARMDAIPAVPSRGHGRMGVGRALAKARAAWQGLIDWLDFFGMTFVEDEGTCPPFATHPCESCNAALRQEGWGP